MLQRAIADNEINQTIKRLRETAAAPGECTAEDIALFTKYVQSLGQTERTVFLANKVGLTPQEIAEEMGLERKAVCRMLAKFYSELRVSL